VEQATLPPAFSRVSPRLSATAYRFGLDAHGFPRPAFASQQRQSRDSRRSPRTQIAGHLSVKLELDVRQKRRHVFTLRNAPLRHIKMGLYLRFDWRDVLAWLERQKRPSIIRNPNFARYEKANF
jgi:hypothetical protein